MADEKDNLKKILKSDELIKMAESLLPEGKIKGEVLETGLRRGRKGYTEKVPKPNIKSDDTVEQTKNSFSTRDNLQKLAYLLSRIHDMKTIYTTEGVPTDNSDNLIKGEAEEAKNSFATHMYNEINSKIGGNNIEQFLCLLIPGIILNKEDYEYQGIKGPVVEANESRIANKMFDPCQMTSNDNGRTLPYQYKMALDMLTPKINRKLALQKNKLRRLLMSKFPYDFGDSETSQYTMLEVYSRLYDEYMDEIYAWKAKLSEVKAEFRLQYSSDEEYENNYLKWYEDNAGDYLDKINEKKSRLLSVFSPNDMKILEGVLDSGSGAELQEARQNIYNLRKITPNGGYVYPVSFEPPNWFEMIGTSFTSAELMDSPEKLTEKIQRLSLRRAALYSSICDLSSLIDKSFEDSSKAIKDNKKIISNELESVLSGGIKLDTSKLPSSKLKTAAESKGVSAESKVRLASKVALPALEIKLKSDVRLSERSFRKLVDGAMLKEKVTISEKAISDLNSIKSEDIKRIAQMQDNTLTMSKNLTKNVVEFVEKKIAKDKSMQRYLDIIKPLKSELIELDKEIDDLNKLLNISASVNDNISDDIISSDLLSPKTPKGFTKIEFEVEAESLTKKTDCVTSSSTVTNGSGFLFNGVGKRSTTVKESLSELIKSSQCSKIHVCMNIAKVGIVREWFNPGVFFLTSNMYRLCSENIASEDNSSSELKERIEKMRNKIFPCYPVSFVLARDMQIRFEYETSVSEETCELFEKHANSNGGFLFFRGKDEYGNSDMQGVHTYFSNQTVTLKFDTTQIIGYYLQATAADKSTFIDNESAEEHLQNYSMSEYSEHYRQIINDRLNKG